MTLHREFLLGLSAEGDPTLLHGYAITGHVAQGLTVDHAFVLAGDGMSREWAYVALSRGRESNDLYLPRHSRDVREEFAPAQPEIRDPIERLASCLRASEAQVLAIDSGTPDASAAAVARREAAERAVIEAARVREAQDRGRRMLLPRHRRELEAARAHESAARRTLAEARRVEAELRHGARPFVGERELQACADRLHERLADRATERVLNYDRGIGRER